MIYVFISFLIFVQINNFILNKTTPERYGFGANKMESRSISVVLYCENFLERIIFCCRIQMKLIQVLLNSQKRSRRNL